LTVVRLWVVCERVVNPLFDFVVERVVERVIPFTSAVPVDRDV
jgi:hypothetical protein